MTDRLSAQALYRLMAWTSPSFPIGSYAYSHGLEYAVEIGAVPNAETLRQWSEAVLTTGGGWVDAHFFCGAWRAVDANNPEALVDVLTRAASMRGTEEMALESAAQGTAFLSAVDASWPVDGLEYWLECLRAEQVEVPNAVANAVVFAAEGIPLEDGLAAYLHAVIANLVLAGVRLIPLGQTEGQRVLADLASTVAATAFRAIHQEGQWGTAAPMLDWFSAQHETQYTRLFRS